MSISKIACIGAGTIGAGWASYFLWKGYDVVLQDVSDDALERGRGLMERNLQFFVDEGLMTEAEFAAAVGRASFTLSIGEAVKDVQFIQESVFESYDVKQAVLSEIDAVNQTAVFASSTSGLLISEIQKRSAYPGRCITAHPFNPPHLVPLVEVALGKETTEATFETAYAFYKSIGKMPIRVNKEVPGHIANRIAVALWRECIDLVASGVCSVEDVDLACCYGPGLRYALMGPNLTYHLGGGPKGIRGLIDHIGPSIEMWLTTMAAWQRFPDGAKEKLEEGVLAELANRRPEEGQTAAEVAAWRDAKLVALLKELNRL